MDMAEGFCGSFFLFRTVDSLCETGLFTSLCENEICSQVRLQQPKPVGDATKQHHAVTKGSHISARKPTANQRVGSG